MEKHAGKVTDMQVLKKERISVSQLKRKNNGY
jgi:hypothetical protein